MSDDEPFDSGKRNLMCPCGEYLHGETEDELIDLTQAHLKAEHPGHEYTRDQILFMAT
ncbi:MAG: hypothetical protein JWM31_1640 [Solirubrobacterales bacterium]|nr:hypothetical protein [Solirubrobacterales bacterium]